MCYTPLRRGVNKLDEFTQTGILIFMPIFIFLFFAFWYFIIKKIVIEIKSYKDKKMELMQAQLDYYKNVSKNDTQ